MSSPFSCTCGRLLQVPDSLSGKRVRCPACGVVLSAPGPVLPVAVVWQDPSPPPPPQAAPDLPPTVEEIHTPPVDPTPLSRAANVIAIAGFFVFGIAAIFVLVGSRGRPGPIILLLAVASLFVLACTTGGQTVRRTKPLPPPPRPLPPTGLPPSVL